MRNGFTFDGFEPANTTPVPDFLFDVLLAHLSEAELKVLLYIIRRTSGFKKSADAISLTQFQKGIKKRATGEILDEGCGLGDRTTILKALASLEKKGCIQCEKSNDPQGDKAISVYRIKFRSDGVVGKPDHLSEEGSGQTRPPWWANPTTVVGRTNHRVVGKPDLQETVIQDTDSQETVLQEGEGANAPTPAEPYASYKADLEKVILYEAHLLAEKHRELEEQVDEKLEEVEEEQRRRTPGEHPAVKPTDTESHYHIADSYSAIGKPDTNKDLTFHELAGALDRISRPVETESVSLTFDPDDVAPRNDALYADPGSADFDETEHEDAVIEAFLVPPKFSLPSKGASTHERPVPNLPDTRASSSLGTRRNSGGSVPDHQSRTHEQTPLAQAPGTGMPLPAAAVSPYGCHGDVARRQAHPLSAPTPAQAEFPPAGSMEPAPTAQASGHIPRRPRGSKPAVLELSLLGMDVKRWIEEIRGVKVRMTENNVRACNALADTDGVSLEALRAYFEYVEAQKWTVDLLTAAGETKNQNVQFLSFESNWPKLKRKVKSKEPPDLRSAVLVDEQWNIYKIPGDDTEYTFWNGRLMTVEEADPLGYNGGAGLYITTKYKGEVK